MIPLTITDVRAIPGDSAFLIDDGETAVLYDTGFGFTGYAVAEKIRGYIDHEDKTQPLSDERISQMLRADGLDIARRTVAKYRLKLDIPGTAARRRV